MLLITCGEKKGGNHPPRIDMVRINPEVIHTLDRVILNPVVSDPDGDEVTISYQWRLNGSPILTAKSSTLSVELRKGDRIEVELTPDDGKTKGKIYRVGPLIVKNSPPQIIEYTLSPINLTSDTTLALSVKTEDIDGDRVEVTVDWELNGNIVDDLKNHYQISPPNFRRGDKIVCILTATDGEDFHRVRSTEIEVKNAPPKFVDFNSAYQNGKITVQVTGSDPDGDPIILELVSGPATTKIDRKNLRLTWEVPETLRDAYTDTLLLKLSDPFGGNSEVKLPITISY
ncbi:hypothetical protein DRP53_03850 [candidate division WOR-3 bacterium]|uniref:Uncharacterized protein n=1 Tax=candidate division WOR-3 bacterium TaxID=2052148 RepID=A0A660SKX4_UNCW3|nr:MAG: hypothetical protein DRP53_03850 [candidate division WOR-3 bacterium]